MQSTTTSSPRADERAELVVDHHIAAETAERVGEPFAAAARERRRQRQVVGGFDRAAGDAAQSPERAGHPDAQSAAWRYAMTFSSGAYFSITIFCPTLGKLIVSSPSPPAPTVLTTVPSPHLG